MGRVASLLDVGLETDMTLCETGDRLPLRSPREVGSSEEEEEEEKRRIFLHYMFAGHVDMQRRRWLRVAEGG